MKQNLIFISLFFWSCGFSSTQNKTNSTNFDYQKENALLFDVEQQQIIEKTTKENDYLYKKEMQSFVPIDTVSLCVFWANFQNNLRNDNKQEVIDVLEFPIRAIFLVLFKYAYDCDTIAYIEGEKQYGDFDIYKNNVFEYYDFIFSETLKEIVQQISFSDLLNENNIDKNSSGLILGLTLQLFPKNYNVKVNCSNDHLLKFHISFENKKWNIEIGGL